jgi:GNAT superfamily N-acetyltransferase
MAAEGESRAEAPCELLEWDSEHFGFPIARVTGSSLDNASGAAIDDWCRERGIRCLYFNASADDAESARIAADRGYRVVDVRITGRHSLEGLDQLPHPPSGMVIRDAEEDEVPYLRALAARSHRLSRFRFDGGFPQARCDALYEAWIERGFRDPARRLSVALLDGEHAGYHVHGPPRPDGAGYGELAAVDERHRGKGVAFALHVAALRFDADSGAIAHLGNHSVTNVAIIRVHERLGYLTEKADIWHHKWYA